MAKSRGRPAVPLRHEQPPLRTIRGRGRSNDDQMVIEGLGNY
jgi:hypothetical protein